jgi:hypothetical protein
VNRVDPTLVITGAIIGVGSILLLGAPVFSRYRRASAWIRAALSLAGFLGLTCSALEFYLMAHQTTAGRTTLPWGRFWALDHIRVDTRGVALGILICLALNPEFWRFGRRANQTSNQSLEPTAEPGMKKVEG